MRRIREREYKSRTAILIRDIGIKTHYTIRVPKQKLINNSKLKAHTYINETNYTWRIKS